MTTRSLWEGAVDLLGSSGTGALWGMTNADLNATLLARPPGHEVAEHVNPRLKSRSSVSAAVRA